MRVPRIAFDIMLLAFYLVTANPATTGMPLHEYLGVGVFVLMVAHVVMSDEGLGGRGRWTQRVLNGVLLAALAFCVVSGIMVSGARFPPWAFMRLATIFGIPCTPFPPKYY